MPTENYMKQINDLTMWFEKELKSFPALELSSFEYNMGVSCLTGKYAALRDKAFKVWLNRRNYELGYDQICNAFFGAMDKLGILQINQ